MAFSSRSVICWRGWRRLLCSEATTISSSCQRFVRVIQRAIRQDLDLAALQQPDRVAQLGLDGIDLLPLRLDLVQRKTPGHAQAGRVIGDRQELSPRWRAASAICWIESRPSLQVEWQCNSARMSLTCTSSGSLPASAASTSPRSSRSSGGIQGSPSAA